MNLREMRMALAYVMEPGDPRVRAGGNEAVERSWRAAVDGLHGEKVQTRCREWCPGTAIREADRVGARFIIPGDEEWPRGLEDLEHGPVMHGRGGSPTGLWWKGPPPPGNPTVAVVGARAASAYGVTAAAEMAAGLSELGHTIVSGGAHGIDAAAHRGALAAGGHTVLVAACGVDVPYPRGHAALHAVVAQRGAIVSEYPPGATPLKPRFLARNRLIAAWAVGVVLVEAAMRSGARNTIHWANTLSRVTMAVPGTIGSSLSMLPHQLIRDQQATLVTAAEEIASLTSSIGSLELTPAEGETRLADSLDAQARLVLEALPWGRAAPVSEVCERTDLDPATVAGVLAGLERRGVVTSGSEGHLLLVRGDSRVEAARPSRLEATSQVIAGMSVEQDDDLTS